MKMTAEQTDLYKWYAEAYLKRSQIYGNHEQIHFFQNGFFLSNKKGKCSPSQTFHSTLTEALQRKFPFTVLAINQKDETRELCTVFAEQENIRFGCMFMKKEHKFQYAEGLLTDKLTIQRATSPHIQTQLDKMVQVVKNVLEEQKENRMYNVTGLLLFEHLQMKG